MERKMVRKLPGRRMVRSNLRLFTRTARLSKSYDKKAL